MLKFTALSDDSAASKEVPMTGLDGSFGQRSGSSSVYSSDQDVSSDASFYLHDISSVYEEGELPAIDTSSTVDVGSTVFQNFLLFCDDEGRQPRQSTSKSTGKVRTNAEDPAQTRQEKKVVSLPQFLWQSDALCCHAEANELLCDDDDGLKELVFFEEPDYDDEEDENDDGAILNDNEHLTMRGDMPGRSVMSSVIPEGGTPEGPRYVPRPSSATPGLREFSILSRSSSTPDVMPQKKFPLEEQIEMGPGQFIRSSSQPAVVTPFSHEQEEADDLEDSVPLNPPTEMTKSHSTPPTPFHRRLLDRSIRSTEKNAAGSSISMISRSIGSALKPNKTAPEHSSQNSDDKKTSNPVKNLFRRKIPSLSKPKFQALSGKKNSFGSVDHSVSSGGSCEIDGGNENHSEIASILSSLASSLKVHEELKDGVKQPSTKKTSRKSKSSGRGILKSYSNRGSKAQDQPLASQGSEDTQDDSSFEEVFSNVDDSHDLGSPEDDEASQDSDRAGRLFAMPYDKLLYKRDRRQNQPLSTSSSQFEYHSKYASLRGPSEDRTKNGSVLYSIEDLSRTSSVDTAKASNLSYDPVGDRARLLDLQAFMKQQQEEWFKRQNAPPIDFEAGDNVIRVRDAICEIEVLPKRDLGPCSTGKDGITSCGMTGQSPALPLTAAEI
jgi:hypothetical protein